MRAKVGVSILISIAFLLVGAATLDVGATITGTPVPETGDWTINNATTVKDEVIVLSGNLLVNDGGSLTLDNATLKMNCTTDGQYGITVKSGGGLTIQGGSHITNNGAGNYHLWIEAGATFSMKDSKLEYCGYQITDHDYQRDYKYTGPYFKCDGIIENSIIDNCLQGIISEDNTFTVKSSTVQNSMWHNIEGRNTKNLILDDCYFIGKIVANAGVVHSVKCNVEFYAGCTGVIKNNKISYGGSNNVWCKTDNIVTIENNEIWGATKNGIWASDNCDLKIRNNIIRDNTRSGIWISEKSKVECTGNTIKDNGILENPSWDESGHGFAAFDSQVTFSDNTVGNNWGHNFETTNCTATFENNNFSASRQKCNVEFFDYSVITAKNNIIDGAGHNCFWMRDGVKGTIEGNTMMNSPHNGIWAGNECELTIKNNIIDTCVESGIYSYNCTLTIENNEIKNCGDYGIYGEGCAITQSGNTFTNVAKGEILEKYYIQIQVVDKDNNPMPDANFVVKDSAGSEILSGTTDLNGLTPVMFVSGTEALKVEASWGDYSGSMELTPSKTGTEYITIKEKGKDDDGGGFLTGFEGIMIISSIVVLIIILNSSEKRKKSS